MKSGISFALILTLAPMSAFAANCPTEDQVKVDAIGALPNGRFVLPYPSQVLTGDPTEDVEFVSMRITFLDPRYPQFRTYAKIKCDYRITIDRPGRHEILVAAIGDINDVVQSRASYDTVRVDRNFRRRRGANRYYCTRSVGECAF